MAVIVQRKPVSTQGEKEMTMVDPTTGLPVQQQQQPPAPVPLLVQLAPTPAPAAPPPGYISEAQLNDILGKVRKEEHDKLYPQIEEQRQQLAELTSEREGRIEAERLATEQAEEAERQRQQSELTIAERLQQVDHQWNQRFEALEQQRQLEAAIRDKDMQLLQVAEYRTRRLSEEAENIMPEFLDFVRGNNADEIERSIDLVKAKTAEVVNNVQQQYGLRAPQQQQRVPIIPVSGMPSSDGLGEPQRVAITPDQIRELTIEEYVANRDALMNAASMRVRESGVYGAP